MRGLVFVALAGCTHFDATAQPTTIARHGPELRAAGYARVEVEQGGTVSVAADDLVVVTLPGTERSHLWGLVKTGTPDETQKLTLGNFVAGCTAEGRGPDCMAARARGSIRVGRGRRLDPMGLGIGLFGLATTVVGFTCLAVCSTHGTAAYVGTGLGVVVMLVPLATVF